MLKNNELKNFTEYILDCCKKPMVETGTTVIFIADDSGTIKRICNEVVWFDDHGQIKDTGNIEQICRMYEG